MQHLAGRSASYGANGRMGERNEDSAGAEHQGWEDASYITGILTGGRVNLVSDIYIFNDICCVYRPLPFFLAHWIRSNLEQLSCRQGSGGLPGPRSLPGKHLGRPHWRWTHSPLLIPDALPGHGCAKTKRAGGVTNPAGALRCG